MSLEQDIQKLTAAVEALTAAMQSNSLPVEKVVTKATVTPIKKTPEQPAEQVPQTEETPTATENPPVEEPSPSAEDFYNNILLPAFKGLITSGQTDKAKKILAANGVAQLALLPKDVAVYEKVLKEIGA